MATQTHQKKTTHQQTAKTENPPPPLTPETTDTVTPLGSQSYNNKENDKKAWQTANPLPSKYAPLAYGAAYPETSSGITPAMKTALYGGV